jgi:hypothetical protein
LPLVCAGLVGWLVWRSCDKAGALMAGLAAFALACWLLDAAARHWSLRRLSVGLELASGAFLGGGMAFLAANSSGSPSLWLAHFQQKWSCGFVSENAPIRIARPHSGRKTAAHFSGMRSGGRGGCVGHGGGGAMAWARLSGVIEVFS